MLIVLTGKMETELLVITLHLQCNGMKKELKRNFKARRSEGLAAVFSES